MGALSDRKIKGAKPRDSRYEDTNSPTVTVFFWPLTLLSVILAGDARLLDKLRRDELVPLGSRMRVRLTMDYAERAELVECVGHMLDTAGNASLMTEELIHNPCDHAAGNYRVLCTMAAELLAIAAKEEIAQLDEALFLRVFTPPKTSRRKP